MIFNTFIHLILFLLLSGCTTYHIIEKAVEENVIQKVIDEEEKIINKKNNPNKTEPKE